ncbi:MAG: hypothetical protein JRG72_11075, partial [Deltaproteobacteria bacterium]|nr:hypothetical protein [Deltaproteobacteria bacterium]
VEDLARAKEDLETIEDLFLETVDRVARRSGEVAKKALSDIATESRKTTSVLKEKAGEAAKTVGARLKELGIDTSEKAAKLLGRAARSTAEEAGKLAKRSLEVAAGALSGMWKGAKEALKREKKED